ncbi:CHAP domain-containing protein [Desulfonispora thiosulfatigenes]|nr:CHAP domain-containing protein [Desulfonispora thiosulfatigenes]
MDQYKNVAVYYNGTEYTTSHGKHYSADGYYYGLKWQCVEYVKRFYYEAKKHPLPNLFGNAKDFYDPNLAHGEFNADRGLVQYKNGGNIAPMPDDILVFTHATYGHVAIITEVGSDYIEIIQQNVGNKTREKFKLTVKGNSYIIEAKNPPTVWLRKI